MLSILFVTLLSSTVAVAVVTQYYEADVNKEHVIRGNSAILKCLIPSFVADFVEVVSWHTNESDDFYAAAGEGGPANGSFRPTHR